MQKAAESNIIYHVELTISICHQDEHKYHHLPYLCFSGSFCNLESQIRDNQFEGNKSFTLKVLKLNSKVNPIKIKQVITSLILKASEAAPGEDYL